MTTITSANAKLTLTVTGPAGIVVGPFTVQGYATDDAFATEMVDSAEAVIGVDGFMSGGFTPYITKQQITLFPNSPSVQLFETWLGAQKALRDLLEANGVLALPGPQKAYGLVKGYLTRITPMPPGKKILQPMSYEISWEDVIPAPITV